MKADFYKDRLEDDSAYVVPNKKLDDVFQTSKAVLQKSAHMPAKMERVQWTIE